jgi:DhnA family fructose-bisphosphate aldolase class Ia
MKAGAAGIIAGRNMWQREKQEALPVIQQVHEVLRSFSN